MKYFITIMISLFVAYSAQAKTVELRWDKSPTPEATGSKVCYVSEGEGQTFLDPAPEQPVPVCLDAGAELSYKIEGLEDDKSHWFAVFVYSAEGAESGYSNVVMSPAVASLLPPRQKPAGQVGYRVDHAVPECLHGPQHPQ